MFLSSLCNLILLHLSQFSSVGNSTSDVGSNDLLEVTDSTDCGRVVRDIYTTVSILVSM
jgi:hypothetical protein